MTSPIISISGIRGIPGESLLPPDITRFTAAFVRLSGGGPLVVGRDGRSGGDTLQDLVVAAARMCGADVIDIGVAPTPTVQLAVEKLGARGGIAITASHNPQQWNGLKFLDATGVFLDARQNAALQAILADENFPWVGYETFGERRDAAEFWRTHVETVLAYNADAVARIRTRAFTIVVDAVNASGSHIVPALLRELGCTVIPAACDGSGLFPHAPEPLPHNLVSLGEAVLQHRADMGFAIDPDADRLVVFTEKGEPYGEEYTVTTAVSAVLARCDTPSSVHTVVNLSTTRAVDDIARSYGATVHRTPVGEINVVARMLETGAVVGGEGSGGVIVPAIHPGRDSLVGILLLLDALSGFDGPVSAYRAQLPEYSIRKFTYSTAGRDSAAILARICETYASHAPNTADGVRIDFPEGWVHLRLSNTEPIMRVIAEAPSGETAEALAATVAREAGLITS